MRRLVIGAAAILAMLPGSDAVAQCADCPLGYEISPYPERTIFNVFVGWPNQPAYTASGLPGPMLIPLEISTRDQDLVLVRCEQGCEPVPICGDWTVDWQVAGYAPNHPTYPFRQGSVVDPHANRGESLDDRWAVLYLPPEDLAVGETRSVQIHATVRDLCQDGQDRPAHVLIGGTVSRNTAGWNVDIGLVWTAVELEDPPECGGDPIVCELVGPNLSGGPAVTERFRDIPDKMYVDEVRALTFAAQDMDLLQAECGIPNQPCSTFESKTFCDEITYYWSVEHANPSDTGSGVFEAFGTNAVGPGGGPRRQTVMFTATTPGFLRLRINAVSKTANDAQVFFHDIQVLQRRTKYVDHSDVNQHEIFYDGSADISYRNFDAGTGPGIEWVDWTGDGTATTTGDQNFPMAYTRGAQPQMRLFLQLAPQAPTMPGAVLAGNDVALGIGYQGRLDHAIHRALPTSIACVGFTTTGALPGFVGRHQHDVTWDLTYIPMRIAQDRVQHVYRVYTVLLSPNPLTDSTNPLPGALYGGFYRYWESAYDISCKAATGATNSLELFLRLMNKLNGMSLAKKDRDGVNTDDGGALKYWGDVATVPYGWTSGSLQEMLSAFPTFDGIGRSLPMTQLARLCLGVHGEGSFASRFSVLTPVRMPLGSGTSVPTNPPVYQPSWFFIKNHTYGPHASSGDTAQLGYYIPLNQMGYFAPPLLASDTDPDRSRDFYIYDMTQPHNAAWATVTDVAGMSGIGATNPRTNFIDHMLLRWAGGYYDPSYGNQNPTPNALPFLSPLAFALNSVDGIGAPGVFDPNRQLDLMPTGLPAGADAMCVFPLWTGAADSPLFQIQDTYF